MSHLVVRGMATEDSLVTAGLGPSHVAGGAFFKAVSGVITMFGSLTALYRPASDAQSLRQDISIDIDLGH